MTARLRFTVTEESVDGVDVFGTNLTAAEIRMRYPQFRMLFPEDCDSQLPGLTYTSGGRQWQIEPEVEAITAFGLTRCPIDNSEMVLIRTEEAGNVEGYFRCADGLHTFPARRQIEPEVGV